MERPLKFNMDNLCQDLIDHIAKTMKLAIETFYKDATSGLSSNAKSDSGINEVEVKEYITAQCWFGAKAILESYGVGQKADRSANSYWQDYIKKSPYWNPVRKGTTIVGRPAGEYTNIFGEMVTSKGGMSGVPLEFQGYAGTYSIQQAESWWIKNGTTKLERWIETEINKFFNNFNMQKYVS